MELYHVNDWDFAPGTIINPGDWGRPILTGLKYAHFDYHTPNYAILFREYVFEQIRFERYENKPSRLKCTFTCPTKTAIYNFWTIERQQCGIIYRVEIIDKTKPFHVAPMRLTSFAIPQNEPKKSQYYYIPECAEKYWSYPQKEFYKDDSEGFDLEALTESPIRIIEQIDLKTWGFPVPN